MNDLLTLINHIGPPDLQCLVSGGLGFRQHLLQSWKACVQLQMDTIRGSRQLLPNGSVYLSSTSSSLGTSTQSNWSQIFPNLLIPHCQRSGELDLQIESDGSRRTIYERRFLYVWRNGALSFRFKDNFFYHDIYSMLVPFILRL